MLRLKKKKKKNTEVSIILEGCWEGRLEEWKISTASDDVNTSIGYQERSGIAWRVSAGENVDTLSTDNSFGESGCEGKKALTGGAYRVSFIFCFLKNIV